MKIHPGSKRIVILVLIVLWGFLTTINMNKAFHIDDTAHLEIGQWIGDHPLHPMSGQLNWQDNPEAIHKTNQPHLYFYLLAFWGKIFGYGERAMHLLQSLFVLAGIWGFYSLATRTAPRHSLWLTAFFALNPAFAVNQNLMVDVPLIAVWILFYLTLISDDIPTDRVRFLVAALLCSVAVLIKYSSLPLIPALILSIILRKRYSLWYFACIPIIVLVGWSLFNLYDYGGIHIFSTSELYLSPTTVLVFALGWILCLGAIAPFTLLFLLNPPAATQSWGRRLIIGGATVWLILLLAVVFGFLNGSIPENEANRVLYVTFLVNGLLLIFMVAWSLRGGLKSLKEDNGARLLLLYWFFSGAIFIILFAPFIATRHVLLIIPPLMLILAHRFLDDIHRFRVVVTFLVTVALTAALAVSDWTYADFYRKEARNIREAYLGETVWFTGHWGWQWYAKKNGLLHYAIDRDCPQVGDYLAYPVKGHQQKISKHIRFKQVAEIVADPIFDGGYLSTANQASFYRSDFEKIPWSLSRLPVDKIIIYEVTQSNCVNAGESVLKSH